MTASLSYISSITAPLVLGYCIGKTTEQMVANFIGLATLRHGTNPISYFSIRKHGFKTEFGGSKTGGDYGLGNESHRVGKIYFTHDNSKKLFNMPFANGAAWFLPRVYIGRSTYNYISHHSFNNEPPGMIKPVISLISILAFYIFPTIKVHLSPKDVASMKKDYVIPEIAVCTDKSITPINFGITGVCYHGFSSKTPKRMLENKIHVITGVFQIALISILFKRLTPSQTAYLINNKFTITIGALVGAS